MGEIVHMTTRKLTKSCNFRSFIYWHSISNWTVLKNQRDLEITMPTTLQDWKTTRAEYILILESEGIKDLIEYSNKQSRYKSQSRYGILYPFLRVFGFADEFKTTDGKTIKPIEFGATYDYSFHEDRIAEFKKQVAQDDEDVKTHLYYNTFRSYTSGLELNSWIQNNQGARGYIDKDKLKFLPLISTLVKPFEDLRIKLFNLSLRVYKISPSSTAVTIQIPKGYSILRRDRGTYTAAKILEMVAENCQTPATKDSIRKQVQKYINTYSSLLDGLIADATVNINILNSTTQDVNSCILLIGAASASAEKEADNLAPKLKKIGKSWDLPDDALTNKNLLSNFSQWRNKAITKRVKILSDIRIVMETHNQKLVSASAQKKLKIADIGYYTGLIKNSLGAAVGALTIAELPAAAIISASVDNLSTLTDQIVTASSKLDLEYIEIAEKLGTLSKDEVKVIDEIWQGVLSDTERFIKQSELYINPPKKDE